MHQTSEEVVTQLMVILALDLTPEIQLIACTPQKLIHRTAHLSSNKANRDKRCTELHDRFFGYSCTAFLAKKSKVLDHTRIYSLTIYQYEHNNDDI